MLLCELMVLHDLYLVLIGFFSEVLGTVSGFGSSTFFVPAGLFFESLYFVMALTSILHCFSNFSKITLFREHFSWKYFWKLAVPSILLTAVGAVISKWVAVQHLIHFLGAFLVLVSILFLLGKEHIQRLHVSTGIAFSGLSGFVTGLFGTGGALRGLVLSAMNMEKNQFVVMSSAMDLGGDLLRAIIYISNGYMDWTQWLYIPLLAVAAFFGAFIGKKILATIDQALFEKIVSVMVLISGIMLLIR